MKSHAREFLIRLGQSIADVYLPLARLPQKGACRAFKDGRVYKSIIHKLLLLTFKFSYCNPLYNNVVLGRT